MSLPTRESILIIDDDPTIFEYLHLGWRRYYADIDVKFIQIHDPTTAILEIERNNPLLVILDYDMPKMNGISVMQAIVRLPTPPGVIFLSNYPEYRDHAFQLGALHYFSKAEIHVKAVLEKVHEEYQAAADETHVFYIKLPAEKLETEDIIEVFDSDTDD